MDLVNVGKLLQPTLIADGGWVIHQVKGISADISRWLGMGMDPDI